MKFLNVPLFLISLALGLFVAYITMPPTQVIYVYPNPVLDEAKLNFELNQNSGVKASVYDLNGRLIDVVSNQNRNAGSHTISFSVSNFHVGTYFVVLETESSKKVVKFIKY